MSEQSAITIEEAIAGRQSIRAFLPREVERATIEHIIGIARRAPSGSNMQPWKVIVLTGPGRQRFCDALVALHDAGDDGDWEYPYYSDVWREPYLARRRKTGWGLYGTLGIAKGDRAASRAFQRRNYQFFGAPVGMIFTIDRDLAKGSWLDYGMFLQSIMIAARSFGLETCPQAAFCVYHSRIQELLEIPAEEMVVCGMGLGFADPDAAVNSFRTEREEVAGFTRFVGDV
ncbi:MAG: nitroreductase [Hyphomicrobiaceae bacterium]